MTIRNLLASSSAKRDIRRETSGGTVLKFTATWCGPCKAISPDIKTISDGCPEVVFWNVDVDDHEDLADEFGVKSLPTVVYLGPNGRERFRKTGSNIPVKLNEFLSNRNNVRLDNY